ncbi:phytanoyl-CoA dioxygenase family protein, partial [Salmonella enterica]|uniref:phytanoyl-CoA dioxygenase family protein n=2 Tax=Salmonella enterica TaxID=28901 RepID=UPI00359C1640
MKKPGNDGHCYAHQDWSMVEEPRYTSVTVWCALMDMTPENGCLRALKGSHQIDNYVRGRNTYDYLHLSSAFIHKYLMQNIPMKAGEAIIFN